MSVLRYAFLGDINSEVAELRSEEHCLRASLSEQDLESVGRLSPRAGFRRTTPSSEKLS